MGEDAERPVDIVTEQMKKAMLPPTLLLQSTGSGVARGYAEAADYSARMMRETMEELSRCTEAMLAARNPFSVAACFGTFLMRLGHRNTERTAEIGSAIARTGTSMLTPQADGTRPPAADGGSEAAPPPQRSDKGE